MSENVSSNRLPAVLVGGPPHSGKSVLIYSLSQALRARGVQHYALRACPDGEGDWSNEAPAELVREIRIKGPWTPQWVERISRDIRRRHLPLLVDVGGRPTAEQAKMFALYTHAVLLTPDAAARAWWLSLLAEQRLPIVADLQSDLHGMDQLDTGSPAIRGVLAGLERASQAKGPAFEALVERLAALFAADDEALRRSHLEAAPAEITVDLDRLARTLNVPLRGAHPFWQPEHVPLLLDYLPAATPLAAYGRGPVWLYAALARLASPALFANFDVRLGWAEAVQLNLGEAPLGSPLRCSVQTTASACRVTGVLPDQYIDYSEVSALMPPPVPTDLGVMLSGKMPLWLYTSLAITYHSAPWLAVCQPQLDGCVVVSSSGHGPVPGSLVKG
jgi:CRISPR-associated protein Csx3